MTTITSTYAIKRFATAAAIAGALGMGALGVAGTAAAAPSDDSGSTASAPAEQHAAPAAGTGDASIPAHLIPGFTPKSAPAANEPVIPAHLIPGFTPKPAPAATAPSGPTSLGDIHYRRCIDPGCEQTEPPYSAGGMG